MTKLPNFFVVGAVKAGTTSLYYYFKQHPEIYMSPIKEPHYFSKDIDINSFREDYKKIAIINIQKYFSQPKLTELQVAFIRDFEHYKQLFREVKNEKAIGEISNSYLYSKVAAQEIRKTIPDAKIIMILRDPVERAFSHYLMNLRDGLTSETDFVSEVINDFKKNPKGWGISHLYIELGLYYNQVKRYLETFPEKNVKIILYDDYKENPLKTLNEIWDFLEVSKDVEPDMSKRYNTAAIPKYPRLNTIARKFYTILTPILPLDTREKMKNYYKKITMKPEKRKLLDSERRILLEYFEEDIKKLSKLINRDLSNWLKTEYNQK